MREYALVLLVTAAVTYLLVPLVRRIAVRTGAMHEPRARDTHTKATPLLGGLAMYGGLVAGLLIASRLSVLEDPFKTAGSRTEAGLLLAGGLVVVVGFVDDRWGLSAISKLAGQVAAAGILVWSGQALPWLPTPSGGFFPLEPDLSVTLTILIVVVTINAINFIDGLDGLAAGIVAVAALSFLVYTYTIIRTINTPSQSLPAVASALLAGMCLGFLPHNFYPARIFMGDIGAMLLGLMLAYGPISSTDSLAPALLINYTANQSPDRFPTILPLLMPAAILIIPYADLMFAIVRRIRAGKPIMVADRQHLHHRLLNIGHSYRQSVLLMYLWAALFSVTVVSLSLVRSPSVVFAVATLVAVLALLPVTMPRLRPRWAFKRGKAVPGTTRPATPYHPASPPAGKAQPQPQPQPVPGAAPFNAAPINPAPANAAPIDPAPANPAPANAGPANAAAPSGYDSFPGYSRDGDPFPPAAPFPAAAQFPAAAPFPGAPPFPGAGRGPDFPGAGRVADADPAGPAPGYSQPRLSADSLSRPPPRPSAGPFPDRGPFPDHGPFPAQASFPAPEPIPSQPARNGGPPFNGEPPLNGEVPLDGEPPFSGQVPFNGEPPFNSQVPFNGETPFPGAGPRSVDDPLDWPDSYSQAQPPDTRPS